MTMKHLLSRCLLIVSLLVLTTAPAMAKETHIPDEFPTVGRSIRALGMGNAFITMEGTDEAALYYNPAALNDLPSGDIQTSVTLLNAEFNYSMIDTARDVVDLSDRLDAAATDSAKTAEFNTFVTQHAGEYNTVDVKFPYVNVIGRNFGVGLIVDSRTTVALRDRSIQNFEIRSVNNGGVVLGGAQGILFDDIQVGLRVKAMERVEIDRIVTLNELMVNNYDLGGILGWSKWQKGFGVGVDAGAKYHLPFLEMSLDPVVAVVYENIGKMRFTGNPNNVDQSVSAAFGIHPQLGDIDTSIEFGGSQINQKIDTMRKLHGGVEFRLPKIAATRISLRGGFNQGYITTGATVQIGKFRIAGAFYGEEAGEYTKRKANYRTAGELTFVF